MTTTLTNQVNTNLILSKSDIALMLGVVPCRRTGRIRTGRLRKLLFTDAFLVQLGMSYEEYVRIKEFSLKQSKLIKKEIES